MDTNHDGKPDLMKFLEPVHPNAEISLDDLEPGGLHALPSGFTLTNNPMNFSDVGGHDPNRVTLFGPHSEGVAIHVSEKASGAFVKGLDLIIAIARLVQVGPPNYQRSLSVLADWWKREIANCAEFLVPEAPPRTRPEMEAHIDGCEVCQPVGQAMARAINAGSSAYRDADMADLIQRAHDNSAAAISHYQQKAAAHSMTPTHQSKPSKRKAAAEEVPA